jgi:hypothetical protein
MTAQNLSNGPKSSTFDEAKRKHDFGVFCFRCEIGNHGRINALDVAIPMKFWFGNKGGEQNAVKFTPIVSPLDAGQNSAIYFVNDCPSLAVAVLPDAVSLRIVGESRTRSAKLNLPHRNPGDSIIMLTPTKTSVVSSK